MTTTLASLALIITGARDVLGGVLCESQFAGVLGEMDAQAELGLLPPLLLAAAIRTVQGFSTVAIITSSA